MHVDRRLLGWGPFFVLLGAVSIAVRAGLLDKAVVSQWPLLWPVLLIGGGLGLLLRGTPLAVIGGAITAITFGVMGGGAIATGRTRRMGLRARRPAIPKAQLHRRPRPPIRRAGMPARRVAPHAAATAVPGWCSVPCP